ncbi:hypothetical protein FA13DRAFT_1784181 [Coprinellus micaceus]|uniref:Uncharacterized protein n=1 Tax=Coprinellus micaceus TaxID=71717 RepID=A0A4Y7TZ42_COPMI|nr:hypothetical protein FA13DRAFT_1784181 [Coprinellus micaceus]
MATVPGECPAISAREERVVNSFLDQGPKAFFIVLTHRQATKLEKAVRDKERVTTYDIGDPQLNLVMWSAVPTDAETIRNAVRVAHRRLSRRPLMEVIIIFLASAMAAALGGSVVWMTLAYGPPDINPQAWLADLILWGAGAVFLLPKFLSSSRRWLGVIVERAHIRIAHLAHCVAYPARALSQLVVAFTAQTRHLILDNYSAFTRRHMRLFQLTLEFIIGWLQAVRDRTVASNQEL